jgi:glyoxylase-like metal-dependent hydrolase (beta-lactamase superfamily II)
MITEERVEYGEFRGVKVGGSVIGKPIMKVIFYHLDNILIDTGPYLARRSLQNYINEYKIDRAILTHYHEDHAGNARYLLNSGITIQGHEKTVSKLKKKIRLKPYEYILFGQLEQVLIDPLPEVVHTKNFELLPIHTPGHSCDHIVYHEPNRGWLFSGDLFLGQTIKFWRKDENMLSTLRSLDLVLKLNFDSLFCGHNPKLNNPKKYLVSKRQQILDLIEKVNNLAELGFSRNEIIRNLTKGKEHHVAKWFTLGDVSYKNMIIAAMNVSLEELQQ